MSGSIQSLENVGIVVDDLAAAKAFFVELGLEQVGEAEVAGEWVDRVVGLEDVRCELSMLQTPDGHGRLELMRFNSPAAREGDTNAPPNTLGIPPHRVLGRRHRRRRRQVAGPGVGAPR
jgi:catechol 2,3-dioxygenase-like lactoylglutathione lyase family enzyme